MNDHIETLFIESKYLSKSVIFGVVYRRPNANIHSFLETLDRIFNGISLTGKLCVMFGDFNINLLKYLQTNVRIYIDLLASYGCYPLINKPTRFRKQSATIIDHIWCNDLRTISESGILLTDVTDHFTLFIQCKGKNAKDKPLYFTYTDYDNISPNIHQVPEGVMSNVHLDNDENNAYDTFSDALTHVTDKCVPTKRVKMKAKEVCKPWITTEMITYIKERHSYISIFQTTIISWYPVQSV